MNASMQVKGQQAWGWGVLQGGIAALGCVAALSSGQAQANDWPQKPVRLIVPATAGGGSDSIARMWADCIGPKLGQPVVVENRGGAFGIPAIQALKQGPADGYTLFFAGMSHYAITPYIYAKQPYFPEKDFAPVSLLVTAPYILATGPKSKIGAFADIAKLSQQTSGGLNFGSPGNGSPAHLMQAILSERLQAQFMHVPFQGEPAGITSLAGDQIDLMLFVASTALPQVLAGKIKPLAVFGEKRMAELPDVPTVNEVLHAPELSHGSWGAIVAKSGTPAAIVNKVHEKTQQCLKDPALLKRYDAAKQVVVLGTVEDVRKFAQRDTALWKPLVQRLGIRND